MKLILVLLTKAGKIVKILGYIYSGLLAAEAALEVLLEQLPEEKGRKLKKIIKFVSVGAEALKKVLEWLGKKDVIDEAESEASEITSAEFQRKITLELELKG